MLVSLSGSHSNKLALSITTNKLARSGLVAVESASLEERDPDNKTDRFGRYSLKGGAINWMMKCDGRWKFYNKCIKMYIFYVQRC